MSPTSTPPTPAAAPEPLPPAPPGEGRGLGYELRRRLDNFRKAFRAADHANVRTTAVEIAAFCHNHEDAVFAALAPAPSPTPASPWVAVTADPTSLPPDCGTVLVWLDPGEKGWRSGLSLGSYDSYCGWGLESWDGHARVTHWQRIVAPAAPAAGGTGGDAEGRDAPGKLPRDR